MSAGWARKRFWKTATVAAQEDGFTVLLDGRPVRTPAKTPFLAPTQAAAAAAAAEWDAQEEQVDPGAMPVTRMINTALDRVAPQIEAVRAEIAGYGGTDLLCYRADSPATLVANQAAAWDPLLAWAERRYGARLTLCEGVMPVAQPQAALSPLNQAVAAFTAFELTALHDLVTIPGSLIIGLAVAEDQIDLDEAWRVSRIDEDWQISQWGEDAEAAETAARRRADLDAAATFLALVRDGRAAPDPQ